MIYKIVPFSMLEVKVGQLSKSKRVFCYSINITVVYGLWITSLSGLLWCAVAGRMDGMVWRVGLGGLSRLQGRLSEEPEPRQLLTGTLHRHALNIVVFTKRISYENEG